MDGSPSPKECVVKWWKQATIEYQYPLPPQKSCFSRDTLVLLLNLKPHQAFEWEQSQGGGGSSAASNAEAAATGDISSVAGGSIGADLAQPASVERATSDAALEGDASVQPPAEGAASAATTVTSEIPGAAAAMTTTTTTTKATDTLPVETAGEDHPTGAQDYEGGRSGDDGDSDDDDDDDNSEQEEVDEEKEARIRQAVELSSPAVIRRVAGKLEGYHLPAASLEELRETLKGFVGTKNYHNYTNHKKPADPSCKRCAP